MVVDKLADMFEIQMKLQERLPNPKFGSQEYINAMTLGLIEELVEAMRETNHKTWKNNYGAELTRTQRELFQKELIDAWHFLVNLTLASGMSPDKVYEEFLAKNKINNKRVDEGY